MDPQAKTAITANRIEWITRWDARYCEFSGRQDATRDAKWSKVISVLEVMACSREDGWLLHIDFDAVIVDMGTGPSELLERVAAAEGLDLPRVHLIFSEDYNDEPLNSGVYLARTSDVAMRTLTECYNNANYHEGRTAGEQLSIVRFMQTNPEGFKQHSALVPVNWFNEHWLRKRKGSFIVHFAGGPKDKWDIIARSVSPGGENASPNSAAASELTAIADTQNTRCEMRVLARSSFLWFWQWLERSRNTQRKVWQRTLGMLPYSRISVRRPPTADGICEVCAFQSAVSLRMW